MNVFIKLVIDGKEIREVVMPDAFLTTLCQETTHRPMIKLDDKMYYPLLGQSYWAFFPTGNQNPYLVMSLRVVE